MTPTAIDDSTAPLAESAALPRERTSDGHAAIIGQSAGPDPYATFMGTRTFGSLNGVRCLCCLGVIIVHVELAPPIFRLVSLGWLGVDMFFVISGFLIVTLLLRERARVGSISLKKFYIRRSLRIFPVYYGTIFAVIAFFLLISPWRPNGLNFYLATLPWLLTYTLDFFGDKPGLFFPCWSLAMEEQFYQVWPAVERFAAGWLMWLTLALMLMLNLAIGFGFFDGLIERAYGRHDATQRAVFMVTFTPILLGVLIAHCLNAPGPFRWFYAVVGYRAAPLVIFALLIAFCEIFPHVSRGGPRLSVQVLMTLLLTSLVIREDHLARPLLAFPWVARLGVISYGMYVYQTWVIAVIVPLLNRVGIFSPYAYFVVATAATILVAEASFRLMEEPLLRLKGKYGH